MHEVTAPAVSGKGEVRAPRLGDICEGGGFVWMLMPNDSRVSLRTRILEGETGEQAAHRLLMGLLSLLKVALATPCAADVLEAAAVKP